MGEVEQEPVPGDKFEEAIAKLFQEKATRKSKAVLAELLRGIDEDAREAGMSKDYARNVKETLSSTYRQGWMFGRNDILQDIAARQKEAKRSRIIRSTVIGERRPQP